ncbi:MAG: lysyl oxidase family protein [Pyrinomonadaceae bacterium]
MKKWIALSVAILSLGLGITVIIHRAQASPGSKAKPDLIVDQKRLLQNWVVRDENLPANFCSVIEGGITPGEHRLLRFTVSTPNIGTADVNLGDPSAHFAANDGLYEFASCHRHFHFRHYALYELLDQNGNVWRAAKRGFCMIDIEKYQPYPGPNNNPRNYLSCGAPADGTSPAIPGNQGISVGWADTYVWQLGGQYFVLDGGDGQAVVPPGTYTIRITVNPPFTAAAGEPCPAKDSNGFCHQLPELNYGNNISEIQIDIPDHPGKQGVGPLKNQPQITAEPID